MLPTQRLHAASASRRALTLTPDDTRLAALLVH